MSEMNLFTERIPITDDVMFAYVMRQPDICAAVIECLIPGIHIAKVQYRDEPEMRLPDIQHTIQGELGTHSVRLDVYLDDGNTIYNVEMQTSSKRNLAKRSRFYASRIDSEALEPTVSYQKLRPTYVIFICTFDPFGKGLFITTALKTCAQRMGN